jgi:hypothetical protein
LNEEQVEYLIVGGYAVIYHGHPRTTADIDLWFADDAANLQKLRLALHRFGFSKAILVDPLFDSTTRIVSFGIAPFRVDLFARIEGVRFEDAFSRREMVDVGDFNVPMISLRDLRAAKEASGRPKDLADLEVLPNTDP